MKNLRTLDLEWLEEFLRADKSIEAFCTPPQLRDMEFFTHSVRCQQAVQPLFSYIAKRGGLADPASFSIQPTTGGQRCSSKLTPLKEISSPFKLYKTPRSDAMSCRKTSTSI
ncbi:unnamed protein product [Pleuronectes platessa]|uniref:Uncharacterized protein n=1 Tax=Pleuronectes platessa TaxID=8262 RepID=A0A9N7UTA0_PLEPL|nr:unnamed protein product [Pleuronectes platessa]